MSPSHLDKPRMILYTLQFSSPAVRCIEYVEVTLPCSQCLLLQSRNLPSLCGRWWPILLTIQPTLNTRTTTTTTHQEGWDWDTGIFIGFNTGVFSMGWTGEVSEIKIWIMPLDVMENSEPWMYEQILNNFFLFFYFDTFPNNIIKNPLKCLRLGANLRRIFHEEIIILF